MASLENIPLISLTLNPEDRFVFFIRIKPPPTPPKEGSEEISLKVLSCPPPLEGLGEAIVIILQMFFY
jgi:hypothetical protein